MYLDNYKVRSKSRVDRVRNVKKPYSYRRRFWWSDAEENLRMVRYAARYGADRPTMYIKALEYKPKVNAPLTQNEYWATPYAIADAHQAHAANIIKRAISRRARRNIEEREKIIDDLPLPLELQKHVRDYYV